jgi:hypothetical protein
MHARGAVDLTNSIRLLHDRSANFAQSGAVAARANIGHDAERWRAAPSEIHRVGVTASGPYFSF